MIAWFLACSRTVEPPPSPSVPIVRKPGRRDPKWANARCNDGTPFGYAIRPAAPDGSVGRGSAPPAPPARLWVVNLAGGSFCDDEGHACSDRPKRLTTALPGADGDPTGFKQDGVFSLDPAVNPTFAAATQVDAHYCTSDLWLGDTTERRPTTGDPSQGWYFDGRENVRVLLESLHAVDGLDEADPRTRILVLGTSAGAAGVVGNLDQIAAAWPHAVADHRLHVVLDGGWVAPPPAGAPLPDGARWGVPERGCAADALAAGTPVRDCVLGPRWWPYVARSGIPILVQISGLDKSQLPIFGIDQPEEQAAWRAGVRQSLVDAGVPWVFSGGRSYHVVAIEDLFGKGPPGSTFREVLDRFWRDAPPERVFFEYPD